MSSSPNPALDGESKQPTVIAISVVFASLSSIVVALRLYTRLSILRIAGPDDWTILIATILSVGSSVGTILEAHWGLGRHVWTVTPDDLLAQMKAFFFVILTYNFANNVAKVSFLFQYRRIFSGTVVKRLCLWLLGFVGIWAITQAILLGVACVPVSMIIPSMADKCLDALPIWYFSSAMNILTDFVIFLVPLPSVYGLKLRRQQKILVLSIFGLGFFVCIISIVRIFTLRVAAVTEDPTWDNTEAACWSLIELNCGILCASLPTLRPLLGKMIPSLASSRGGNEYQMYGTGRDGDKTTLERSQVGALPSGGSTEALKDGAAMNYDTALEYGRDIGRSTYVTSVYTGDQAKKAGRESSEKVALGSPKTKKDILVTTEMVVLEDSGRAV